jgi:hypothetical protein
VTFDNALGGLLEVSLINDRLFSTASKKMDKNKTRNEMMENKKYQRNT